MAKLKKYRKESLDSNYNQYVEAFKTSLWYEYSFSNKMNRPSVYYSVLKKSKNLKKIIATQKKK